MHDQPLLAWARARRMLDAWLLPALHGPVLPLDVTALHVHGEPIGVAEARRGVYVPFAAGDAWGAAWDTTWFRLRGGVPAEWAGEEVVVRIGLGYTGQTGFGAEALLWDGDTPAQGISPNHDEIVVARPARGGESVDLLVEAAANPAVDPQTPDFPLLMPDPGGAPLFRLARAEICVVHRDVEAFCRDLALVLDLSQRLGGEGARAGALIAALRRACVLIDPESPRESLAAARAPLCAALDSAGAPRRHRVVAQGHAHIDTAWLWPLRETVRKCTRSFSTVLTLMRDHPDFRFACSQAQHYAWMQAHHPALFAQIRERVASGQWEPVGGMWVESDCNLTAAESLVRQVLHGKLFCIEQLGVEPRVGWLPDTFGFPATLPQILREAGLPWFVTQKVSWNQTNAFPHSSFWWEGLDGSRVLTHFPPAATYNGDASPTELLRSERGFRDHGASASSLYLFGWGDGGGGPTRGMLDNLARLRDVDGLPLVEQGVSAHDFFARVEREDGAALPEWRGEMYLERHRGVYTTQGRAKQGNRDAERLLREAELWSCLHPDGLGAYPAAALDEAWKLALLHQFHDILPGTSIHWAYEDTARDHDRVRALAGEAIRTATEAVAARADTGAMGRPVLVFNAASAPRREVVDTGDGLRVVSVPALGYTTIDTAHADGSDGVDPVEVGHNWMANGRLRLEWDGDGLLTSILDSGREVLAPGERGNLLQLFRDHPTDYDAWEIDGDDLLDPVALATAETVEVVERNSLRAALRTVRSFGGSSVEQTMVLRAGSRRIDFHTRVHWQEKHRLLKVAFPIDVRAERAAYDVGFGHVERPTHENTGWEAAQFEVPAHRFADLSEHGYGVALLNDSKHGYDVRGHTLRLTLLRSPTSPDPVADRGDHEFTYALLPHPGGLVAGGVRQEAEALDLPLRCVPTTPHAGDLPRTSAAVRVEGGGVAVTAVKKAERGDALVVRLCEVAGGHTTARVTAAARPASAARCDLLERARSPLAVDAGGAVTVTLAPFQLATLRFETIAER